MTVFCTFYWEVIPPVQFNSSIYYLSFLITKTSFFLFFPYFKLITLFLSTFDFCPSHTPLVLKNVQDPLIKMIFH